MSDASFSGYAVGEGINLSCDEVENIGKWDERWRFKRANFVAPRSQSLQPAELLDPLEDVRTCRADVDGRVDVGLTLDPSFPDVPNEALSSDRWKVLWASFLVSADAIHFKEAHAALAGIKHVSRNRLRHGKRILFLLDSMCCTLSFSKGRCVSPQFVAFLSAYCLISFGR